MWRCLRRCAASSSPLGQQEYALYAKAAREQYFQELFDVLDKAGPKELETLRQVFSILGRWHREKAADSPEEEPDPLIRVE